jgi:hypothetical protein
VVIRMAVGVGDISRGVLWEEDGGAQTMGKGRGGTDKMHGGGGGMRDRGRGGRRGGMAMGSLVFDVFRKKLASWRGAVAITITVAAMVTTTARVAAKTRKLADCQRAAERDEGVGDNAKERGGQSLARHAGNGIMEGMRGQ